MLDNKENELPDATENQSNDKVESLSDEVSKDNLEAKTKKSKKTKNPKVTKSKKEVTELIEVEEPIAVKETEDLATDLKEKITEVIEIEETDAVKETEDLVTEIKEKITEVIEVEEPIAVKETEDLVTEIKEKITEVIEVEETDAVKETGDFVTDTKEEVTEVIEVEEPIAAKETEDLDTDTKEEVTELKESDTGGVENDKTEKEVSEEKTIPKEVEGSEHKATTVGTITDEPLEENKKEKQEAAEAIEKQVAKDSENLHRVSEVPMGDYQALELGEIVTTIEALMLEHPIQAIKKHMDALKKAFNKQFGRLLKEAKTSFLKEGGNTIDFHYENPIQEKYNKVLFEYKKRVKAYYKEIEKKYENNLLQKKNLIDELKELIDNGEANSMYKHFSDIQKRWREIGPVSRESYSDLWRTYHFHVERFYDLLHLRNDLRDLDFKHNLDEKLKLIARVEILAESDNITEAFNELQEIHRLWKEEIGPVSRDKRDEVWERFSKATNKIHDKRHSFYDSLKDEYKENLLKKNAVIDKIAAYDTSGNAKHNDWQRSIKEIATLREEFFAIGKVSRSKNNVVWERFKEATKVFNKKKNTFYKEIKVEQDTNLKLKMKLVEQAESLRDSEDWDNVTEVMKQIQSEWKTIGHVPRKFSDKIWNRFKEACNHYFDRLHNKQDVVNEEKFEVYAQKKQFLEGLKNSVETEGLVPDLKQLKAYIKEWNELGAVPLKQRYIERKFNKFLDNCFGKLSLGRKESTMIRYQNMINSLVEQKDFRKLENEIQFVRKKLEEVTKEKQQLENNMQFFSNADESNPMIKNILKTIDKHEKELSIWEAKLQYLRTISI